MWYTFVYCSIFSRRLKVLTNFHLKEMVNKRTEPVLV